MCRFQPRIDDIIGFPFQAEIRGTTIGPAIFGSYCGWTVLHAAALAGHIDIAQVLIWQGANISPLAKDHTTPLSVAQAHGHSDFMQSLLEQGAPEDPPIASDLGEPDWNWKDMYRLARVEEQFRKGRRNVILKSSLTKAPFPQSLHPIETDATPSVCIYCRLNSNLPCH